MTKKRATLGEVFHRYHKIIFIIMSLLTVLFIYGVTLRLSVNVILEEMIPPHHPYIKLYKEYVEQYGGSNTVLVALKVKNGDIFNADTLEKIKRVSDEILFNKDVRRALVYSIAQRKSKVAKGHAGGTVDVSALMWPEIDKTPEGIERLKYNVFTNEAYNGFLVSRDGKATLIIADCWPDIDYSAFFNFIQALKQKEEDDNTTLHIAGRPMLLGWIYHFMPRTILIFGITFAFIIAALIYIFRNLVGVTIPLLAGIICTIWGFGFIGLLGVNFNPLMIVLPVLVGARGLSHSVQVTRRYLEELNICGNKEQAAIKTIDGIFLASLAAIVTDAAAFSVLILARIPMIQKISFLCSFWVISILLVVGILGPMLCMYLPTPRDLHRYKFSWERDVAVSSKRTFLDELGELAYKRSNLAILLIFVAIGVIATYLASGLKIGDTHPGSPILWPDSQYNRDCEMINKQFDAAGTDMMSVIVEGEEGAVEQPEVMKRIDLYERYITHKHPDIVAGTQSLTTIVKVMNKEFHEGDARYLTIPDDLKLIGQLLFFYHMAGDPGDYTTMVDAHYRHTIIRVYLKNHLGDTLREVVDSTKEFFSSQPKIEGVKFRYASGYGGVLAATNEEIVWSQTGTLLLAFITVVVFCGIAFRSVVAALLLCLPLLIANMVAFAYMALKNIGLDVNTLPVSAVGLGVGVDYGIYLLSRMEEEIKNNRGDWETMTHTSLNSAGKGVFVTALTIIIPILLWPLLSELRFNAEMGLMIGFLMFFDMVGALTFLPAAVNWLKPKFMRRYAHLNETGEGG
jgi:hypothetical protein